MMKMLRGQETQGDIIFLGYQLYKDNFFHHDIEKQNRRTKRMAHYFFYIILMLFIQIYFIQ